MPSRGKHNTNGARLALSTSDMKKSVSFNRKGGNSAAGGKKPVNGAAVPQTNGVNGDTSSNHDSDCSHSDSSQWYTRPMHLAGTNSSTLKDLAALGVGLDGAVEDAALAPKDSSSTTSYGATSVSSVDALAREFFPVTLGPAYDMLRSCTDDESSKSSHTPSPVTPVTLKGLSNPWKSKRAHSPGHNRKSRPGSAQSSSSSNSKSSIDRMYLMTVEAPNTGSKAQLILKPR
ncbi:hypothetical protein CAPTEDRAFT_206407 [Capitella teleta]|uniref:Uncharacterized protein n=1 Tax=Capitella teleta TaxID=283909 RepID=R7T8N3_CAPTE|nr:hypothetical protein CAPTEDRAFT_206407 [Capitella teleta]|eukprot:ELT90034.1 hypothetical protein CAPTEDRAFT_206407 [Capitella teleta]